MEIHKLEKIYNKFICKLDEKKNKKDYDICDICSNKMRLDCDNYLNTCSNCGKISDDLNLSYSQQEQALLPQIKSSFENKIQYLKNSIKSINSLLYCDDKLLQYVEKELYEYKMSLCVNNIKKILKMYDRKKYYLIETILKRLMRMKDNIIIDQQLEKEIIRMFTHYYGMNFEKIKNAFNNKKGINIPYNAILKKIIYKINPCNRRIINMFIRLPRCSKRQKEILKLFFKQSNNVYTDKN